MKKKAQLTIFVIIAILIVLILILAFNIIPQQIKKTKIDKIKKIKDYIDTCIKERSIKILFDLGKRGWQNSPITEIDYYKLTIPSYNFFPSHSFFKEEFSKALNNETYVCIENAVKNYNGSIIKNLTIDVKLKQKIIVTANYKVQFRDKGIFVINKSEIEINFNFDYIYNLIKEIVESENMVSTLIINSEKENFKFDILDLGDYFLIVLYFPTEIENKTYTFAFLKKKI